MINEQSIAAVEAARWDKNAHFIKPLYETCCFAQIPALIQSALSGGGDAVATRLLGPLAGQYDKVVFFFVDAFGWRFFEQWAERSPFLRAIVREGVVSKLTSQFPSTTAAHVTTIHTGLPVGSSGVYEWFYYEPKVDAMIAPLLFSYAGDKRRNTLKGQVAPEAIYPGETIYDTLAARGVKSYIFQHSDYTPSPISDRIFAGATVRPYLTLPDALTSLVETLVSEPAPSYYFLYFDKIDTMGHARGPHSAAFAAEIDAFLLLMAELFHGRLAGRLKDTLFLMSADHGQVPTFPAETIYLNRELPNFARYLKQNRQGRLLVPGGSCRDMFLYIREELLDEAEAELRMTLGDRAAVYRVADLIAEGFFGPGEPSPEFLSRVGNLVVLPYGEDAVWWYEADRFAQMFYGNHGGLTRAEMEIPLLARAYA